MKTLEPRLLGAGLLFTVLALGSSPTAVSAEALRGELKGEVVPDGPGVVLGLGDLVQVSLPAATKFTRALEIEITIPRDVFPYRSNMAVFLYQNFAQTKAGPVGDRVGIEVLPPAAKFYLEAPLVAKAGLKAAIDTAVVKIPKLDGAFPLALSIAPIDKELPPGWEKFQFTVKARLVHANLGGINLLTPGLSDEDRKRVRVTANGVVQPSDGPLYLEPGPYTLGVELPGGDTVTQTVVVSQAKTVDVTVDLVVEGPSLVIEAPEGTQVVIDGKRLVWKPSGVYPIDLGAHNVQLVVGNTVVADTVVVDKGGRHRLSLKMSLALTRE
jgi:hypothetical protein